MAMSKLVFPLFAVFIIASGIMFLNSSFDAPIEDNDQVMQSEIKAIIKTSCYDCHSAGSKNEDAVEALNFDTFDELGKVRKITRLKEMADIVKEREMPPKKYISKNPKAELTDDQIKLFTNWTDQEIKALIGN
jgi:uncharacterized membrane protein